MSPHDRVARLERLLALSKRIVAEEEIGRLLELALESAMEFTDADRGFVLLREPDGAVRVRAARNLDRDTVRSERFRPSRSIADRVLSRGEVVLTADASEDDRFTGSESIHEMASRSALAIPIRAREQVVGAMYLDKRVGERGGFDSEDLRLLQDFGDVAALAVEMRHLVMTLETQGEELRRATASLERMTALLQEDVAAKSVEIARVERDLDEKNRALNRKYTFHNIIGRSPLMHDIFDVLRQVMDYPVPVLVTGESGTGKELIARALHHGGPRSNEPFMAINCAAIPENLLESELFGYKRGAFTGASADKEGLFRTARGGTVFLDEIGELPQSLQGKLLRVLQEKEIRPIGGRDAERVAARIIAATNRDLRREIAAGRFREDLFYRLNVVHVRVPPLRDRPEDIPALAEHFLERFTDEFGLPRKALSAEALQVLMSAPWPGNVRQLENAVKSSAILCRRPVIGVDDLRLPEPALPLASALPAAVAPVPEPPPPARAGLEGLRIQRRTDWERHERERILEALVRSAWNKTRAADQLGMSRRNLYRKLVRYGIEGGEE